MMKGLTGFLWIGANAALFEVQATAKTSCLTTDNLGTPRINTDANAQVTARHDYMPFGEKLQSGVGTLVLLAVVEK